MQLLLVLALVFASFVALALQKPQTRTDSFLRLGEGDLDLVIALSAAALGALSPALAGLVATGCRTAQPATERRARPHEERPRCGHGRD